MSYPQYGIYLIPPPPLLYPLGLAHQLLAGEFKAYTAGKFMVHCTVKGFFKLAEGASPADFTPALDALFARTPAFNTEVKMLVVRQNSHYGSVAVLGLDRTEPFHALHNAVWDIVRPYIAPDCLFSPIEGAGPDFFPHLTLGMADLPTDPGLFAQVQSLCQYVYDGLPKGPFVASDMQLIEFYSEDWAGHWWDTLNYKQLKGWRLASSLD